MASEKRQRILVVGASGTLGALLRLCLIRGIVQLSGELGLTHWCALMEPKLLRLLQMSAIYFHQISGMVEHHGLRQPSCIGLFEMLDRVRQEKPIVWDFITGSGELWQPGRISIGSAPLTAASLNSSTRANPARLA